MLGVWLGLRWGLSGAAAGIVVARIVLHVLLSHLAIALLGLGWIRLLKCHLPGLWAGAWVAGAVWVAGALAHGADWPAAAALAAQIAAGGAPPPPPSGARRRSRARARCPGPWSGCPSIGWEAPAVSCASRCGASTAVRRAGTPDSRDLRQAGT